MGRVRVFQYIKVQSNCGTWHGGYLEMEIDPTEPWTVQPKQHSGNKYHRPIPGAGSSKGESILVDVYSVIEAFGVQEPGMQQAIKKILCARIRGKGDRRQDIQEAIDALTRQLEIEDNRNARNQPSSTEQAAPLVSQAFLDAAEVEASHGGVFVGQTGNALEINDGRTGMENRDKRYDLPRKTRDDGRFIFKVGDPVLVREAIGNRTRKGTVTRNTLASDINVEVKLEDNCSIYLYPIQAVMPQPTPTQQDTYP